MPRSHRFAGTTSSQLIVGQAICFTIRVECVPPENMDSLRLVHEKQRVWVPVKKNLTYIVDKTDISRILLQHATAEFPQKSGFVLLRS